MAVDLLLERETTIVFNEEEDEAMVWSASNRFHHKMKKIGVEPYKSTMREIGQLSAWYKVPKTWVKIRPPIKQEWTEERKAAASARLASLRKSPINDQEP